jgi:hypothetical protein
LVACNSSDYFKYEKEINMKVISYMSDNFIEELDGHKKLNIFHNYACLEDMYLRDSDINDIKNTLKKDYFIDSFDCKNLKVKFATNERVVSSFDSLTRSHLNDINIYLCPIVKNNESALFIGRYIKYKSAAYYIFEIENSDDINEINLKEVDRIYTH